MKMITCLPCVLLFFLSTGLVPAAEDSFNMNVTLDGVKLGKPISGTTQSVADLKNHVVLLEFWGTRCPPCLASLPHLVEWQKQYADQGLIVIGTEAQNSSVEDIQKITASKGVNFTIVAGSQVEGGNDFSGIPHCMLFDHTGKCLYRGSPFKVEERLKQALADAPAAALAGRPLKKLDPLAQAFKKGEPAASILKKAQAQVAAKDADTADEAQWIVEKLTAYGNQQLELAGKRKDSEPFVCWSALQKLSLSYKGTDLGKSADTQITELKKDKAFMTEIKAAEMLTQIHGLEGQLKGEDPRSTTFQNRNKDVLNKISAGLATLKRQYPDSKATAESAELAKKYGLL